MNFLKKKNVWWEKTETICRLGSPSGGLNCTAAAVFLYCVFFFLKKNGEFLTFAGYYLAGNCF